MMVTMTVKCLPAGRRNDNARTWKRDTEFFIPAANSTLPRQSRAILVDVKANHRNQQGGRGIHMRLVPTNDRLPSPFVSRRSNPAARPQSVLLSCPLLLQLQMRHFIPLGHLFLLRTLPQVQMMWLCGSERIVKLFMSKLQVRRVLPSRWTTRSRH